MELRLLREHMHRGIVYPAGAILEVPAGKLRWFESNGIGEKARVIITVSEAVKRGK